MSNRERYLVGYDIRDERRLRRVHKTMQGWGEPVQYSVFICDLTRSELVGLRLSVRDIIDHGEDSVMLVRLGDADAADAADDAFEFLGTPLALPDGRARVI